MNNILVACCCLSCSRPLKGCMYKKQTNPSWSLVYLELNEGSVYAGLYYCWLSTAMSTTLNCLLKLCSKKFFFFCLSVEWKCLWSAVCQVRNLQEIKCVSCRFSCSASQVLFSLHLFSVSWTCSEHLALSFTALQQKGWGGGELCPLWREESVIFFETLNCGQEKTELSAANGLTFLLHGGFNNRNGVGTIQVSWIALWLHATC